MALDFETLESSECELEPSSIIVAVSGGARCEEMSFEVELLGDRRKSDEDSEFWNGVLSKKVHSPPAIAAVTIKAVVRVTLRMRFSFERILQASQLHSSRPRTSFSVSSRWSVA